MSKPTNWPSGVPYLDPEVRYVGTSFLRSINGRYLERLTGVLVVSNEQRHGLAVLIPYDSYIEMQRTLEHTGAEKA